MPDSSVISWKRAAGLSCLAVYGPFIVMAVYACVSCSHCAMIWTLLPWAPGLIPVEVGSRWLGLPRPPDALWFAIAFFLSVSLVLLLACLIRQSKQLRGPILAVALTVFTGLAIWTYALIRA